MKKCPACSRTYTDETLAFCLEDGSMLNEIYAPAPTQFMASVPTHQNLHSLFPANETPAPNSKNWIIFSIVGFLAIIILGAGLGLFVIFKDELFGGSPYNFANVNTNSSNINNPNPTLTSNQLVGEWESNVAENSVKTNINVNFKADGSYTAIFKNKQGQTYKDNGTWQVSNDIFYQTFSNGGAAKGSIRWIDRDTFEITVIDNGIPANTGLKRTYYRIK